MKQLHRLLKRQIKKHLEDKDINPSGLDEFINAVNEAYHSFEEDHNQLERTLEVSSNELFKINQILNNKKAYLEEIIGERTSELKAMNLKLQEEIKERELAKEALRSYTAVLEKTNRELDRFAYVVSHDLKAPLRAIGNLSQWINEEIGISSEAEIRGYLKLLWGRVQRMEALINGILDYSRAGRIREAKQSVDLYPFLCDLLTFIAPPKDFRVIIQKQMPVIVVEKILLHQIFSNLISNAIKYNTSKDPVIEISGELKNGFCQFCVADNGPGIAPEFHEKIFAIFQTLTHKDDTESTGVGLAIVKKIVEEKGGSIWLESAPGKGSRFFFTYPVL